MKLINYVKRALVATISVLFSTLPSTISAQTVFDQLTEVAENNQLVGMSVAVTKNNEILNEFHYGKANINSGTAINENTIFRVASISKYITALAVLKLHEDGLLDLDADISDYLGFDIYNPNHSNINITTRMLLCHTSTLVDGNGYFNLSGKSYRNALAPKIQELLVQEGEFYTPDIWLKKEPGKFFKYSNLNYGVLATLVEVISKKRFDIYTKEKILDPLNITGSFNIDHINNINNIATLYRSGLPEADNYNGSRPEVFNDNNYNLGTNGLVFSPQGGFRGTVKDLCNIMIMSYNNGLFNGTKVLEKSTLELMHTPQWTFDGNNGNNYYNLFNSWGLGTHITTNTANGDIVYPELKMIGHPGEAYGLISDMYFNIEEKTGVVFITNGCNRTDGFEWGTSSAFYKPEEQTFKITSQNQGSWMGTEANILKASSLLVFNHENHTLYANNGLKPDSISIFNIYGSLIERAIWNENYNVSSFKPGVYIAIVYFNKKQHSIRFYKQ